MKITALRRAAALAMAALLCAVLLAGCGRDDDSASENSNNVITAQSGGSSAPFSEGFDTTKRYAAEVVGDTLCVAFNNIQSYTSSYFTAAGDTLTVTAAANAESENNKAFRAVLWKRVDGGAEYVGNGERPGTIEFTADGSSYTAQFTGLEPGVQYKVGLAYDGRGKYRMSGQMSVQGLAGAEPQASED